LVSIYESIFENSHSEFVFGEKLATKHLKFGVQYQEPGPALAGAGPNARLSRGAPLSSGVMTSSCSVNRTTTFLIERF